MSVPAVISLVTLGVADVAKSTAFYESLGFELCRLRRDGRLALAEEPARQRLLGGLGAVLSSR
jgi:hypothetical protein